MARKRDDTVKLVLRLPPELHRRLTRVAVRKNQSLNSEMIQRLEQSLDVPEQAAALTNEVRSAVKSAFREWRSSEWPKGTRIGSVREWRSSEFELPKGTRIGSGSTAEDDGEKK
jgi:hypothetical protein